MEDMVKTETMVTSQKTLRTVGSTDGPIVNNSSQITAELPVVFLATDSTYPSYYLADSGSAVSEMCIWI